MSKVLQIVGVFASCALILVGGIALIGMGIELLSRPLPEVPDWHIYHLDFFGPPKWFYLGCAMVSAGVTFLWFQKRW
jgi:hypothetical protein